MPCSDGGPSSQQLQDARNVEALLCALTSVLESAGEMDKTLTRVDWQEAGVTRAWFNYWWAEHKRKDEMRRAAETVVQERERAKREALSKLTPDERSLLGHR